MSLTREAGEHKAGQCGHVEEVQVVRERVQVQAIPRVASQPFSVDRQR